MTRWNGHLGGVLLAASMLAEGPVHAETIKLDVHDGRLSLVATNATPTQIFEAWARAGGVLIVNAERMPAAPLTITLDNVPEEQALETLLRPVSGYLARRRTTPSASSTSVFDRIVILATPAGARPATVAAAPQVPRSGPGNTLLFPQAPPPVAPQPAAVAPAPAPPGIQQGPGVMRLLGPDGRPVEDDQTDAPPAVYPGGDAPDPRTAAPAPRPVAAPASQPPQAQPPATSAPVGVPRPGMVVPAPTPPAQPGPPR